MHSPQITALQKARMATPVYSVFPLLCLVLFMSPILVYFISVLRLIPSSLAVSLMEYLDVGLTLGCSLVNMATVFYTFSVT